MNSLQIIDDQDNFNKVCEKFLKEDLLFMDTEFHRMTTYFPELCLIQITDKYQLNKVIIDPLNGLDISKLKEILINKNICKVFHAPDQDFEIFYNIFDILPKNVFDTQTAAGVIGLDRGMGYSRLCKTLLNITIDKTMQKANWLERPLTNELIDYAIKDVEYLIPLHRQLSGTIEARNLWDTYNSRIKKLLEIDYYKFDPRKILKKINLENRSNRFKNNLLEFISLREEHAREMNMPRLFCASNDHLVRLCEKLPITTEEVSHFKFNCLLTRHKKYKKKILDLSKKLKEKPKQILI